MGERDPWCWIRSLAVEKGGHGGYGDHHNRCSNMVPGFPNTNCKLSSGGMVPSGGSDGILKRGGPFLSSSTSTKNLLTCETALGDFLPTDTSFGAHLLDTG